MSLYGSSPFNLTGLTFFATSGAKGAQGEEGPQGFQGNPGFGPTGPDGFGITFLNYTNNVINTIYTNGSVVPSNTITKLTGDYLLEITAATGGNFSPLASTERIANQTITYNEDGDSAFFEFVRRLNFKNIKTNSSPFIQLSLVGPPPNGTEPSETIKVSYSVFNLGTSNVSGGPDGALVINNPGNSQTGFTGTTYNESQGAAGFGMLNVAEQLVVVKPRLFDSNRVQVWALDPTIGSIFYLKDYLNITQTTSSVVTGHHIMVKKDVITSSAKAITIILPPEFTISNQTNRLFYSTYSQESDIISANFSLDNFKLKFEPNIIWQADSYFCPSTKYDAINMVSVGSRYIAIPGIFNTNLNSNPAIQSSIPLFTTCKPTSLDTFYRIGFDPTYGICCKKDCTCELSYDFECDGYFHQGATCGGATGPCTSLGACCMYATDQAKVIPCQELTYCDCANIASSTGLEFVWNPFSGVKKSCDDFNCFNAKDGIGGCCDGIGGCSELSASDCSAIGGYFQGSGINCVTSDNLNVCFDGNGSCCDSGITCENGITGSTCLSLFKTYFGDGTTCGQFTCSSSNIPCYTIIENTTLSPGMEYEDGVVVGIFNPNRSKCFGSEIFSGEITGYSSLIGITSQSCVEYYSAYDYSGYGFNPTTICENDQDSYIMVVSKHPVNIDSTKTLQDGILNTHEFIWSTGAVAWGPLVDVGTFLVDEFEINNLRYKEGYIYDTSNEQGTQLSLYGNSFLTCPSARFDTNAVTYLENRPVQSFIGNWTRNNGLYNTIRLSGAEFFYYNIGQSLDGATMANYAPVSANITAARAISIFNRNKPKTNDFASDWYLPSIDELAFMANECRNTAEINLNSRLVEVGGTPLSGWHWSSTGALNIVSGEGVLTPAGITHGSEAWAINIDVDGISENMSVSRKQRTNEYTIRPIKMIRCDKSYYENTSENFKLWKIPLLSETIIDNQ
jgi:hypothetical protein